MSPASSILSLAGRRSPKTGEERFGIGHFGAPSLPVDAEELLQVGGADIQTGCRESSSSRWQDADRVSQ